MKLINLFPLVIIHVFLLSGCSSISKSDLNDQHRIPSNIEYSYTSAENCRKSTDGERPPSALTGYLVGPTALQNFNNPAEKFLRPYFSDGCSSAPDGVPFTKKKNIWTHCCIEHDKKYWIGGSKEDKKNADENLKQCITDEDFPTVAKIYKFIVKRLAGPDSNSTYRWGYGWNYNRPYGPLSESEQQQILIHSNILSRDENNSLTKMCDTFDPVFNNLTKDEKNIYALLNRSLKNDDLIEWARWGYFNLDFKEFDIKLKSCPQTVKAIIYKNSPSEPVIKSDCDF